VTPHYDSGGNPKSFSAKEQADIVDIWRAVSEDYAPWDVDVTSEDPGVNGLLRSSKADLSYGVRVAIGGSGLDWAGNKDFSGLALDFSFDHFTGPGATIQPPFSGLEPVFAFTQGYTSAKLVAETVSWPPAVLAQRGLESS
jgi:hypothetical protein